MYEIKYKNNNNWTRNIDKNSWKKLIKINTKLDIFNSIRKTWNVARVINIK